MNQLEWDGVFWSGDLKLPGLAKRSLLLEIEGPADYEPDDDDDDEDGPELDPIIARGIAWLRKADNVRRVADAIRRAVTKQWAAIVARGDEPEKAPKVPPKNLDFINVTIHGVQGGRLPYFGLGAHAKWAIEHGVGVLLHGARVIEIGSADVALDEYAPAKDARARRLSSRGRSRSPKRRASRGRPARPRRAR